MGILADAIYEREIEDEKRRQRMNKFKSFFSLSFKTSSKIYLGVTIVSQVSVLAFAGYAGITFGHQIAQNQEHLKAVSTHPLTFEGPKIANCESQYIETAHPDSFGLVQDVYLKSTCEGVTSIAKVKANINTSRLKLLTEDSSNNVLKK